MKHGHTIKGEQSPTFKVWANMMNRCEWAYAKTQLRYGARGIRVCERWHSFENFLADMGERPQDDLTIERINNDGPYSPDNCRWATKEAQAKNTSRTIFITSNGRTQCVRDWAVELGISQYTIYSRIKRGLPEEMWLMKKTPRYWRKNISAETTLTANALQSYIERLQHE